MGWNVLRRVLHEFYAVTTNEIVCNRSYMPYAPVGELRPSVIVIRLGAGLPNSGHIAVHWNKRTTEYVVDKLTCYQWSSIRGDLAILSIPHRYGTNTNRSSGPKYFFCGDIGSNERFQRIKVVKTFVAKYSNSYKPKNAL